MSETTEYPDSAISTWSGFVYQGKVALYHCLKLIIENQEDFELQLDSTEDFAIYKGNNLISAHQVKAKIGIYRSSYNSAFEKASKIEFDRKVGTTRYLHVSLPLDNTEDYTGENNEIVSFYDYNGCKHCGLGEIENISKTLVREILTIKGLQIPNNRVLETNYSKLSERISSKVINIHRVIQEDKVPKKQAAYDNRISASEILNDILNSNPYEDIEHYSMELKMDLTNFIEEIIDNNIQELSDSDITKARVLFEHIHTLDSDYLKQLCQLINPSENFSKVRSNDIFNYTSLIHKISKPPFYESFPYYSDKDNEFYIPTSIALYSEDGIRHCSTQILRQTEFNRELLYLLYEYKNLIAYCSPNTFEVAHKITDMSNVDTIDNVPIRGSEKRSANIFNKLSLKVMTIEDAEDRINAE